MHRIRAVAPWLVVPLMLAATAVTGASNDRVTVLTASRIHTMDPAQPRVEAIAYDADGTIVAAGARAELLARYPSAARVDAGTSTVVPGLIDAHGHVEGLGYTRLRADLVGAASKQEVLARLRAFAADLPAGAWLLGRGWDQNDWPEQRFPTAADLDAAFPDRPVWLERV
ncbi:MAG: amidohydrolase family protein, partial [Pseudomonas sp.]|nr:amidohydrolase family protein [Pseudomonas sp.]